MRLLLVEDEKRMAQALCEILRLEKYEVDHFANGIEALAAIESSVYDIVILDVMLPGMNGYEIAKRVRQKGIRTPILMLTAKSGLEDRIEGLNAGADYYLTKPFDSRELLACINALLRRQGNQVDELTFGNTALDLSTSTEKRRHLGAEAWKRIREVLDEEATEARLTSLFKAACRR